MRERTLRTSVRVAWPLDQVFPFFSDAHNLDRITPPWLRFRVLTPRPIRMGKGATIDYELRVRGVPIRWTSEITAWEPPHRFVDEQVRGPYRKWVHEHLFATKEGGTEIVDEVTYAAPGGILEPLLHGLFVKRDLARIFSFRGRMMTEIFPVSLVEGGPGSSS